MINFTVEDVPTFSAVEDLGPPLQMQLGVMTLVSRLTLEMDVAQFAVMRIIHLVLMVKMLPEEMITFETLATLSTLLHLVPLILHLGVELQVVGKVIFVGTLLEESNVTQLAIVLEVIILSLVPILSFYWLFLLNDILHSRDTINMVRINCLLLDRDAEVTGGITAH